MLGKADWLLRSVTSWPATYFAFLFSLIPHAIVLGLLALGVVFLKI